MKTEADSPKRNPNVVWKRSKDATLLFNPEDGNMWILNETGGDVWKMFNGKNSITKMAKKLSLKYSIPGPKKVTEDIQKFIQILIKKDLIAIK